MYSQYKVKTAQQHPARVQIHSGARYRVLPVRKNSNHAQSKTGAIYVLSGMILLTHPLLQLAGAPSLPACRMSTCNKNKREVLGDPFALWKEKTHNISNDLMDLP
jgi:hypothetical protein